MKKLKFEQIKAWKQWIYFLIMLLAILCVVSLFFRNYWMQSEMEAGAGERFITPHFEEVTQISTEFRSMIQVDEEDTLFEERLANARSMSFWFSEMRMAVENHRWEQLPEFELNFLQTIRQHLEFGEEYQSFTIDEVNHRIALNELLVEEGLPYEDKRYSLTPANFTYTTASMFLSIFGVLLLLFIFVSIYSKEYEDRTIYTLFSQPLRKSMILLSKFLVMLLGIVIFMVTLLLTSFGLAYLFGEDIGSFDYPMVLSIVEGSFVMPIGQLIIIYSIAFILFSSLMAAVTIFMSILFKERFISLIVTTSVLVVGAVSTYLIDGLQTFWNPFFYLYPSTWIPEVTGYGDIALRVGLLVGYSILILSMSNFLQHQTWQFSVFSKSNELKPFHGVQADKGSYARFEWRKLLRNGLFYKILTLLCLFLVGGYLTLTYVSNQSQVNSVKLYEEAVENDEKMYQSSKQRLQDWEDKIQLIKEKDEEDLSNEEQGFLYSDPSVSRSLTESLEHAKDRLTNLKVMLDAFDKGDSERFYDYWIWDNKLWKGEIQTGVSYYATLSNLTYNISIAQKELMIREQIPVRFPAELTFNELEPIEGSFERLEWKLDNQPIDHTSLGTVFLFYDFAIFLLPLIFLLLLFGPGFSVEIGKSRSLQFVFTQPIERMKIFFGKLVVTYATSIGVILGSLGLIVVLGIIGSRFGDWNYPVLFYYVSPESLQIGHGMLEEMNGIFDFITLGRYLGETTALFLAVTLFILTLAIVCSLFLRNGIAAPIVTLILSIVGYLLSTTAFVKFAHFLPFTYLNINSLSNGKLAMQLGNVSMDVWLGVGVLIASTIILSIIGMIKFRKW